MNAALVEMAGFVVMAELFATGIQMGESPRWHDGRFWMCDWMAGEVLVFDDAGNREVVARVEGLPFSIDWLPDGRLVTTTSSGVVVGREQAPYGAAGQPFNEIVVDGAGRRVGGHARLLHRGRSASQASSPW